MIKNIVKSLLVYLKKFWQGVLYPPLPQGEKIVKPVPTYISQIANANRDSIEFKYGPIEDAKAADQFGAESLAEFSFWAWRACSIACLQMVIRSKTDKYPNNMDLILDGLEVDGYKFCDKNGEIVDVGWRHHSLVKIAKKYGLSGKILRFASIFDVAQSLYQDKYVITSIGSKNDSHNVLIYGLRVGDNHQIMGFYYHDPQNYEHPGAKQYISLRDFKKRFLNKGIAVWK
jgi:hypothetical protein